jgi:hypothetical protein
MTSKPKSELMARLREERRAAGLKRLEIWAKPEHHAEIKRLVEQLAQNEKGSR